MVRMNYIIRKITIPGGLVVYSRAGMVSVAKKYTLQTLHRLFVGRDLDSDCVASSLLQLALDFAWKVFSKESDDTGDNAVHQAAFTFFKAIQKLDLKRRINV